MGLPLSGAWAASAANASSFSGALKWGTGINPVHQVYGEGAPLRITGRQPGPDNPSDKPLEVPPGIVSHEMYGYTMEDIGTLESFAGFPPGVGTETTVLRAHPPVGYPDWSVVPYDSEANDFRDTIDQSLPLYSGIALQSFPTETVTEGWENKTTGALLDAETSDPAQYERQTSMQQVNPAAGRNNDSAVLRGTDAPRFNIMTRLTGMKIKPWSTGRRLNDMFPFQQNTVVRPFTYRTAGTADPREMMPNSMYVSEPIARTVPADPYLGEQEADISADNNYGYSTEDSLYA